MKRLIMLISLIVVALCIFASCSGRSGVPADDTGYEGEFEYDAFAGVAVSAGEVKINSNQSFEISEIKVSVGDFVEPGDVLFLYDTQKANLDIERAKLEYERLENSLQSLKDTKARLENEKAAAPQDQQLQYSLEIKETDADILETEYNMKSKKSEIEAMESSIEVTEVVSPAAGTVSAINKSGYDNYGEPLPLIVITETGNMRVKGYVNETNINSITIGQTVTVKSRVDDASWGGTVVKIDTEKPEKSSQGYGYYYGFDDYDDVGSSSKYPFYVELDDSEGLIIGQHVYIIVDDSGTFSGVDNMIDMFS